MSQVYLHWADRMAQEWISRRGLEHVVEIGVSPSGPIHVGFLRETVLGDVITRALRDAGAQVRFVLFVDSLDPLRKRYPFLDESFEEHVGKPLCDIPAPQGGNLDYASAFLKPFESSLQKLGIELEIIRSENYYRSGRFTNLISRVLEHQERVAEILREESGRKLESDWSPVNPICIKCGRMKGVRVFDFDTATTTVEYECPCGYRGIANYSQGEVKLPWRMDWPARWSVLGVTVEPFGKDHASPGGSYATGKRISEEIFGTPAPEPVPYEWINLKGQGAMSSSKGIAITIDTMLEVIPAEVLRYLILRDRPSQAIDFDPSRKLIQIVDEYEDLERRILLPQADSPPVSEVARRNYFLARTNPQQPRVPLGVPFRHLTTLVQVANNDEETLKTVLVRTGHEEDLQQWERLKELAGHAWQWIQRFAPEQEKMQLSAVVPQAASTLSPMQVQFLERLADYLSEAHTAEEIHQQVYHLSEILSLPSKEAFEAIYLALIGKKNGPRAGFFLASLSREFVQKRFRALRQAG